MTVLVHRPTRSTLPVPEAEPETLAAPPPVVDAAGGVPLQFLLPMVGALSSVVMMVVMRNGQPLFLLVAGVVLAPQSPSCAFQGQKPALGMAATGAGATGKGPARLRRSPGF